MAATPTASAHGTFEWIVEWEDLSRLLAPAALGFSGHQLRAIDVGCGTSDIAVALAGHGYESVTAVDREASCVEHMRLQHGDTDVRWLQCDLCDGDGAASTLADAGYDLVFDKGMLDCALVEQAGPALLTTVVRLLAPGGVYALVSFRSEALLRLLLDFGGPLELEEYVALPPLPGGEVGSFCRIRRSGAASLPGMDALSEHIDAATDWWYTQEAPLLTPERRA